MKNMRLVPVVIGGRLQTLCALSSFRHPVGLVLGKDEKPPVIIEVTAEEAEPFGTKIIQEIFRAKRRLNEDPGAKDRNRRHRRK